VKKGLPSLGEVIGMNRDNHLPDNKKEEQDSPLTKVIGLAPLLTLILQILELILKVCGVIN
jgi:hypothetical protein